MTTRQALRHTQDRLQEAGVTDPRSAWLLLERALDCDASALLTRLDHSLPPAALSLLQQMTDRAIQGEPLQYVLGSWDFYGRPFRCDSRALIPRADTETLVEAALQALKARPSPRIVDVGCGTGCIGITLKLERPDAQVTLCDVSPDALALAWENAQALGADVTLAPADMLRALPQGPWDAIVSNPPYINAADLAALPATVAHYEPALALYGGPDGLDFVRALAAHAPSALAIGGTLCIEIGYDQSLAAQNILRAALGNARALRDLHGVERVVCAIREV